MIQISREFSAVIPGREGGATRDWLETLPGAVADVLDGWHSRREGPPMYGMCTLILPVWHTDGKHAVLKVSWVDEETRFESVALRAWSGHGAVPVLRIDEVAGAMLLERLDEWRVLLDVPIQEALDTAAGLLRELRDPAHAVVPLLRNRWREIRGGDETNATTRQRTERFVGMAGPWCLVRSVDDAM